MVEPGTNTFHLYQLKVDTYVEHSVTAVGDVLHLTDPVDATIVPGDLLPPR